MSYRRCWMLIGFCGRAGSGKDTCADYLCQEKGFHKYAFAEPLKRGCQIMFDFTEEQLYGDSKELVDPRYGRSPREVLQRMGTDVIRTAYGDSFWINHFKKWYERRSDKNIVISDIRFQNEIDTINELGGTVFLINRLRTAPLYINTPAGRQDQNRACAPINASGHVSEFAEALKGYHQVINNDHSIKSLLDKIDYLIPGKAFVSKGQPLPESTNMRANLY